MKDSRRLVSIQMKEKEQEQGILYLLKVGEVINQYEKE